MTIQFYRADGVNESPGLIEFIGGLKEATDQYNGDNYVQRHQELFENEGRELGRILFETLPGGTVDQLLLYLLEQKASIFRVAHKKFTNPTPKQMSSVPLIDLLSLACIKVTAEQLAEWTPRMKDQAVEWAIATHLSASDNDDVIVPPRPEFLKDYD